MKEGLSVQNLLFISTADYKRAGKMLFDLAGNEQRAKRLGLERDGNTVSWVGSDADVFRRVTQHSADIFQLDRVRENRSNRLGGIAVYMFGAVGVERIIDIKIQKKVMNDPRAMLEAVAAKTSLTYSYDLTNACIPPLELRHEFLDELLSFVPPKADVQ